MMKIIVAGGTGGFGRTLVNELAKGGQHEIIVFSRSGTDLFKDRDNVLVCEVDYSNESALINIINELSATVLISCLNPPLPPVFEAEQTLVRASVSSQCVKRFVPSQFGIDMDKPDDRMPVEWKHGKNAVVEGLRKTDLEWTLFINGWFMDYFVQPWISPHMLSEVPFIDIAAKEASIPGDGKAVITMTMTKDVARFLRRAVEDERRWEEKSFIVGDQATFSEILRIAEEARGCKFEVTYNDISELRQNRMQDIPAWRKLYDELMPKEVFVEMFSGFGLALALGDADFDRSGSLNARYSDIETTKLAEVILKYWSGR